MGDISMLCNSPASETTISPKEKQTTYIWAYVCVWGGGGGGSVSGGDVYNPLNSNVLLNGGRLNQTVPKVSLSYPKQIL